MWRRWGGGAMIVAALLLAAPSVNTGLFADDHFHALMQRTDGPLRMVPHQPLDLFEFASGDPTQAAAGREEGILGWWSAPDLKLAFWRPLASLSHWLDHQLWPGAPWAMHLHNLAWYGLLLLGAWALYRRVSGAGALALWAMAVYALDDAHALPVSWVAHRNSLIAAAFGLPALWAHHRWRCEGWAPGAWLAPALYGVALLGGESAVAVAAYVLAHALTLDPARGAWRLLAAAPVAAVSLVYLAAHHALGYGARGSGIYLHPVTDAAAFAARVVEYVPVLLHAQLGGLTADVWIGVPWTLRPALLAVFLLTLAVLARVAWPLLRVDARVRFWSLGMLLSALPICATFPSDRLLLFVGLGASGLVGAILQAARHHRVATWPRPGARRLAVGVACLLAFAHLFAAPLLTPLRARTVTLVSGLIDAANGALPRDPEVAGETWVFLNPPLEPLAAYIPVHRAAAGAPLPAHQYSLLPTAGATTVEAIDDHTLRLSAARGMLSTEVEQMVRSAALPMPPGYEVALEAATVRVVAALPDGRPQTIEARFSRRLDDPRLRLLLWTGQRFERVGWRAGEAPREIPPTDTLALLLGMAADR